MGTCQVLAVVLAVLCNFATSGQTDRLSLLKGPFSFAAVDVTADGGYASRPLVSVLHWNPRRCLDHLWFDVTHRGTRFRVSANEFAIPRMDPNRSDRSSRSRTQRYLNVTDEELRRGLEVSWKNKGRPLKLAAGA